MRQTCQPFSFGSGEGNSNTTLRLTKRSKCRSGSRYLISRHLAKAEEELRKQVCLLSVGWTKGQKKTKPTSQTKKMGSRIVVQTPADRFTTTTTLIIIIKYPCNLLVFLHWVILAWSIKYLKKNGWLLSGWWWKSPLQRCWQQDFHLEPMSYPEMFFCWTPSWFVVLHEHCCTCMDHCYWLS